ncbi:hypothetical protein E4T49_07153 [Aureobasidium sp. EXF-10728]|nr:hypothetical protein E4T49_07153 [Aureobasidium sp. EXF-10728]
MLKLLARAMAVVAYIFSTITPHYHAFSLEDPSISYPFVADTVTMGVVAIVAGVFPAVVILLVTLLLAPKPRQHLEDRPPIPHKLWELYTGWLGLALSLASALLITLGLKNFGKPRPSALARCQPDISLVDTYKVSGYGNGSSASIMVDYRICQQADSYQLNQAFDSWPSGHATEYRRLIKGLASTAGLVYFTLYLCAKFGVALPAFYKSRCRTSASVIPPRTSRPLSTDTAQQPILSRNYSTAERPCLPSLTSPSASAAPPIYLLLLCCAPIGGALYICLSRYMDYAHHGFDIISGAVIGSICAFVAFGMYHKAPARGGLAWGPRSPDRAFGTRPGKMTDEGGIEGEVHGDIEMGRVN